MKKLELDPFAIDGPFSSQASNDSRLGFMLDLDLEFVMIPCKWINLILNSKLSRTLDILHRVFSRNLSEKLKVRNNDRDNLRFEAYRFNKRVETNK